MKRLLFGFFLLLTIVLQAQKGSADIPDTLFFRKPGTASVFIVNKKMGLIDSSGKVIVPAIYDQLGYANAGRWFFVSGGKYGLIRPDGTRITEALYDGLKFFSPGCIVTAMVKDGKYGVVDTSGRIVVPFEYDWIDFFHLPGIARMRKGKQTGFINAEGKQVGGWYDDAWGYFQGGYCPVKKNGKWSYLHWSGKQITDFKYDRVAAFSKDLIARVQLQGKYGFIDTTGKEIIPPHYQCALHFNEGLCAVKKGRRWGYVNKSDSVVLPFIYRDAGDFSSGVAPVKRKRHYGYIDPTGKTVIPFKFKKAFSFHDNAPYTSVRVGFLRRYATIDRTGKFH